MRPLTLICKIKHFRSVHIAGISLSKEIDGTVKNIVVPNRCRLCGDTENIEIYPRVINYDLNELLLEATKTL